LRFNKRFYQDEIEFFLETDKIEFDCLWNIIKDAIRPTSFGDFEVTSWTESCSFMIDALEFYFEEFYAQEPPVFILRLLPFGKHCKSDVEKLKQIVELIEQNEKFRIFLKSSG